MAFDEHLRYYYPSTEASIDPYVAKKNFSAGGTTFPAIPERTRCLHGGWTPGDDNRSGLGQHTHPAQQLIPFFRATLGNVAWAHADKERYSILLVAIDDQACRQ